MGKYAQAYAQRTAESAKAGKSTKKETLADWLYADDWDEQKYKRYKQMDSLPYLHEYMDYLLDLRSDREYLARYGMSYSDIHDPRKLRSVSSARALNGRALAFVSSNIKRLYG